MSRRRPTGSTGDLTADDRRIWARVASTVAPRAGRALPAEPAPEASTAKAPPAVRPRAAGTPVQPLPQPVTTHRTRAEPETLEPRRQRRLARERDPIDARIDLHGYGRFQAQDALLAFLRGAQARGYGAVLVITGQGRRGGTGVIRASVHEWMTSPALRGVVSGFSPAHRRHGGDGALYVTIRRI